MSCLCCMEEQDKTMSITLSSNCGGTTQLWIDMGELTAAMEGLVSSPGCGWVTSAPKMIVGMSLTSGIRRESASTRTVFRPPTWLKTAKHSRTQIMQTMWVKNILLLLQWMKIHSCMKLKEKWSYTLTLIFNATFAKYCLLILNTCLVKQHCETTPILVSHCFFRSPTWNSRSVPFTLLRGEENNFPCHM
jgi:hypothetical protein